MKYISTLREGMHVSDVYLCKNKQIALTKAGKEYGSLILQDKTGTVDAKIWDLSSPGVGSFDALDYVFVDADVTMFQGSHQLNVKRIRRAEDVEYIPEDYLPVSSKSIDGMYGELEGYIRSLKNKYLRDLASSFFVDDQKFIKEFKSHSAAKSVHHGFVGGLLEHTLSVTRLCQYFTKAYPVLNRDLLITAAIFHDIGKTEELSGYKASSYTTAGNLLGHITMGAMIVDNAGKKLNTPQEKLSYLIHMILAHHGELEFGSPKVPATAEALILHCMDDVDAKMACLVNYLDQTEEGGFTVKIPWMQNALFFKGHKLDS